jgi:hypothetical protein
MKKKRIQELFPSTVDESEFAPLYEKEVLIPDELDIKHADFNKMTYAQQNAWMEKLRLHLLNLAVNDNHGIFSTNFDLDEIVRVSKELYNYDIYKDIHIVNNRKYLTHGNLNPSNQWFPEMIQTKIVGKSLLDMLRLPKYFYQNLRDIYGIDRHKMGEKSLGTLLTSQFLISSLRIVNRFQPAFNFPATLSRLIYSIYIEEYFDKDNDELWILDPCQGWSGRMTGLLAAFCNPLLENIKVKYYGTDVNKDTADRFEMIVKFWNNYINSRISKDFKLYRSFVPAEKMLTDRVFKTLVNKFDMAFTSPPYFNREVYSTDKNQSANLYSTYEHWRDGFLKGMIENTFELLKPAGQFWLNIADINTNKGDGSFYPLENDSVKIAKQSGFKIIDIYYMISHIFPGNYSTKNTCTIDNKLKKYEPIFVMEKPADMLQ